MLPTLVLDLKGILFWPCPYIRTMFYFGYTHSKIHHSGRSYDQPQMIWNPPYLFSQYLAYYIKDLERVPKNLLSVTKIEHLSGVQLFFVIPAKAGIQVERVLFKGIKDDLEKLNIELHEINPSWNYTRYPNWPEEVHFIFFRTLMTHEL